jgi:hypothetical protein
MTNGSNVRQPIIFLATKQHHSIFTFSIWPLAAFYGEPDGKFPIEQKSRSLAAGGDTFSNSTQGPISARRNAKNKRFFSCSDHLLLQPGAKSSPRHRPE